MLSDGHTISPDWRKPKKQRQEAAHSIFALRGLGSHFHTLFIVANIGGVIGRRLLMLTGVAFFAPFSTYSTWGMEWIARFPMPR